MHLAFQRKLTFLLLYAITDLLHNWGMGHFFKVMSPEITTIMLATCDEAGSFYGAIPFVGILHPYVVVSLDVFLTNVIWSWWSPWSKSDQSKGQWPKVTWINFRNFTSPRPISGMGIKLCPFLSSQISFAPQKSQIRSFTFLPCCLSRWFKRKWYFMTQIVSFRISFPMESNVFDFMCFL